MIETNKGTTKMRGAIFELKADLSTIINSLNRELAKDLGTEEAKAEIMEAVKYGLMSKEEIDAALEARTKKLEGMLHGAMSELIDELLKGLVK